MAEPDHAAARRPPQLFPSGTVCDRFRIDGVLGIGGTGTVFAATDLRDERAVAVKAIPHDAVLRQRARREAAVARRLDHPHVVRLRAVTEDEDYVYVVSDLVDGGDFASALRAGSLSTRARLRIVASVCEALAHAHERGVVHRDVKPANVLLGRDGSVRLADFGIAYVVEPDATIDDRLLGTLSYMAPETCEGELPAAPADVWAAGVLLYEALTGANPFRSRKPSELRDAHDGGARPLSEVRPDLPRSLHAACARALDRNPRRRPTAAALAEIVRAAADRVERPAGARGEAPSNVVPLRPTRAARPTPPRQAQGDLLVALQARAEAAAAGLLACGLPAASLARLGALGRRLAPALGAGAAVTSVLQAFPFWPAGAVLPLAGLVAAAALVAPWPAAALAFGLCIPALGNLSSGLAWAVAGLAVLWLVVCLGAGRRALAPLAAPPLVALGAWPLLPAACGALRTTFGRFCAAAAGPLAVALWRAGPGAAEALRGTGDGWAVLARLRAGLDAPLVGESLVWGVAAALWPVALRAERRGLALAAWLAGLGLGEGLLPALLGAPHPLSVVGVIGPLWGLGILLALGIPARRPDGEGPAS